MGGALCHALPVSQRCRVEHHLALNLSPRDGLPPPTLPADRYCTACQRSDWPDHKRACNLLQRVREAEAAELE